jgi:hypothetical protein
LKQALVDKEVELREFKQGYYDIKNEYDKYSSDRLQVHEGLMREIH